MEKHKLKPPPKESHPTISFEYNQPQFAPSQKKKEYVPDIMPYVTYMRPDINTAMAYQSYVNPYLGYASPANIPPVIVKNYNIENNDITGDKRIMAVVYEDVLPQRKFAPSYTTLGERINDYNFIRSTILNNNDGENIDLHSTSANSLTSFVKINVSDINPYNSYKHSANPLKGLPGGFLLYTSGYPIRHNEITGQVDVAKDSTSINIRLYKMLEGSWLASRTFDKQQNKSNFFEYDEWREVAFYEYIRETILKKKVCPNFINMYGYFISEKSLIDYDKLDYGFQEPRDNKEEEPQFNIIKNQDADEDIDEKEMVIECDERTRPNPNFVPTVNDYYGNPTMPTYIDPTGTYYTQIDNMMNIQTGYTDYGIKKTIREKLDERNDKNNKINQNIITLDSNKTIIEVNPKAYLGKSLVILTESPTYSIFGWASKIYVEKGNIYEMVGRGYHDVNQWMNVLFQIMAALYTMQVNSISIDNFDLERNVFIKDLSFRGTTTDYWKYKIDGVDYYIPNLGYLVMIDSNFKDIDINKDTIFMQKEVNHKLNGHFFEKEVFTKDAMKEKTFDMFIKAFEPNNFGRYSKKYGIVQPPSEIISLMNKIIAEAKTDKNMDIEHYIITYMNKFVNNRIGTKLRDNEVTNKRANNRRQYKKGDIVVIGSRNNTFKFVLYLGTNNGNSTILTKDDKNQTDYNFRNVNSFSLIDYNREENIQQNYKPNEENLTEDGLLETYIINKN